MPRSRTARCGLALVLAASLSSSAASLASRRGTATSPVPILVGGPYTGNNCTRLALTRAIVIPMKAGGYLAVRAAPNVKSKELDRILPGHMVLICTGITERQWVGILYYGRGGEDVSAYDPQDCGLIETAEDKRAAYQGPCQSGWVARRYLWLSAG